MALLDAPDELIGAMVTVLDDERVEAERAERRARAKRAAGRG